MNTHGMHCQDVFDRSSSASTSLAVATSSVSNMATSREFFLGGAVDPAAHARSGTDVRLSADDLTTHAVIVGMTGSGKTGLGLVLVEEALQAGVPVMLIDPKGDLGNLALSFPNLSAAEFAPWVEAGVDPAGEATKWTEGLAGWNLSAQNVSALRNAADVTIYTPGSSNGVGLNLIGGLQAPTGAAAKDEELRGDEISGLVSGLLALVGLGDADPLSSREHILMTNLIDKAWDAGQSLDLGSLIGQVQTPPLRKLGVLDVDTFFPPADRMTFALKLNGLAASPAFAAWSEGLPLDLDQILYTADRRARAAVINISHLSDEERQFVLTLILGKVVTWTRSQEGTDRLRALLYLDEVAGLIPPSAMPPTKKPLLLLLKQARAFGVGVVLATQNPVDMDYKALSNAGTWMIGRLQTERDKARLVDGLRSASGSTDIDLIDATLSGLAKREFLLQRAKANAPVVFTTRWALSYLKGPFTREQLRTLRDLALAANKASAGSAAGLAPASSAADSPGRVIPPPPPPPPVPQLAEDETNVAPPVANQTLAYFLDPGAPWAAGVGLDVRSNVFEAGIVARVALRFDDDKAGFFVDEEWEAVFYPLPQIFDPSVARIVDHDARDLRPDAPASATFVLPTAPISAAKYFTDAKKSLIDYLAATETTPELTNATLKISSRAGETPEQFQLRCEQAADDKADTETAEVRRKLEAKIDRVRRAIDAAQDTAARAEERAAAARKRDVVSGAGDLLGALLGGRRNTRSLARAIGRAAGGRGSGADAERAARAQQTAADNTADMDALEQELSAEISAIAAKWDEAAADITTIPLGLERTDIRVSDFAVVWLPVRR